MVYCGQDHVEVMLTLNSSHEKIWRQVEESVRVLGRGGVVSVPTDTLYGLAASALIEQAVERLFRIKRRPASMSLPLLLADAADMAKYAIEIPELAWRLAEAFFPGPLTLVLSKASNLPEAVSGGSGTIALRVPDHWVPRAIVRQLGAPITGTSANRSGMPGLATAEAVRTQLGSEVDYVIDAGPPPRGVASTVLDISGPLPVIVREGAVSHQEIERVCGERVSVQG